MAQGLVLTVPKVAASNSFEPPVGVIMEKGACPVLHKGASPKIGQLAGSNQMITLEQGAQKK